MGYNPRDLNNLPWMQEAKAELDKMKAGSGSGLFLSLYGNKAIIPPGESKQIRILCHKNDIPTRYIRDAKTGKTVENPNFKPDYMYVKAIEHWFEDAASKKQRAWCPRTWDPKAKCAICEASEELSASGTEQDKEMAYEIAPKDVFLFGVILGPVGKRAKKDTGSPDFRILPVNGSIWMSVMEIMRGSGDESEDFALGNITDFREGYDVKITRPAKGTKNVRWTVTPSKKATPIFSKEDEVTGKWWELMPDLKEELAKQRKSPDEIREMYHGEGASAESDEAEPLSTDDEGAGFLDDDENAEVLEGGEEPEAEESEAEEVPDDDTETVDEDLLDLDEVLEEEPEAEEEAPPPPPRRPAAAAPKKAAPAAKGKPAPPPPPARRIPPKPTRR